MADPVVEPGAPQEQQEQEQEAAPLSLAPASSHAAVAAAEATAAAIKEEKEASKAPAQAAEAEPVSARPIWGTRPPSETSWARLSGATDLLSTIFRFLQLPELSAMYVCALPPLLSFSSSLMSASTPPAIFFSSSCLLHNLIPHPFLPHSLPSPPSSARCGSHACLQVARDEDVWKEMALRMWGRMVDATTGEKMGEEVSSLVGREGGREGKRARPSIKFS